MRSKLIPEDAEVVRTFDGLRSFCDAYFNGELFFLIVTGRQGLAKSYEFENRCQPRRMGNEVEFSVAHYVKGNVTPVEAYRIAFEHRNQLLVFDDAERLWSEPSGRYLLRDLAECKSRKTVSWRTQNKELERQGIPKSFETSSRICLILNRFAFGAPHEYDAVVDRAHFVHFNPTVLEIHKNTALWFWDQEVFDYLADHLGVVDPEKLSSRTYVKAFERKAKGDWKEFIAARYFLQSAEQWLITLEADPSYQSMEQRIAAFQRQTGLGRSTYFSIKRSMKVVGRLAPLDVPRFVLTARPPEVPDLEEEARTAAEAEQRRAEQQRLLEEEEQEYRELDEKYFDKDQDGEGDDDDG